MFFNYQNAGFPFRMPNMNARMPQMPFMPFLFKMNGSQPAPQQAPAESGDNKAFDPCCWCPVTYMGQLREMFGKMNPAAGAVPQSFNPNMWCPMPKPEQLFEMFRKIFSAAGAAPQSCSPFMWCPMPQMPTPEQMQEMFNKMLSAFGMKGDNAACGFPFDMPAKFFQLMLNMHSAPEGMTGFQKLLDMMFEGCSKTKTAPEAPAPQEPAEEAASSEE